MKTDLERTLNEEQFKATKHTPGPVAWQKFGNEYCLTGQYGMRPIILSLGRKSSPYITGKLGFKLLCDGLLVDFTPEHPDAQFIVRAYNAHDELLAACKAALDCIPPTGQDTKSDRAIKTLKAAIAKSE